MRLLLHDQVIGHHVISKGPFSGRACFKEGANVRRLLVGSVVAKLREIVTLCVIVLSTSSMHR